MRVEAMLFYYYMLYIFAIPPSLLPLSEFFNLFSLSSPHPPSLGYQVSTGLGSSFSTEASQSSPLLHMYVGWW